MKLTPQEAQSAVWQKVERELKARLQALRERNDGALAAEETAKTRGSIAMVKEILEWAIPAPEIKN